MIEWRDDLPRWRQIGNVIRRRIREGEYRQGWLISENSLMQEFGVARTTARKAVKWLREDQELVYTRPNLGTFVGPEPEDEDD